MIKVGQKVRFDPWSSLNITGINDVRGVVVGTIVEVYYEHRYFRTEYTVNNVKYHMSFKFNDVYGEEPTVEIIK
jgi:hypothetical protein